MPRSHRRRQSARRKSHWISFHFASLGFIPVTTQSDPTTSEVAYTWAKWPAGVQNTEAPSGSNQLEPIDETLVHTTMTFQVSTINGAADSNWIITAGILPWDSVFPPDFLDVFGSGADNPDPFYGNLDWTMRQVMFVTQYSSSAGPDLNTVNTTSLDTYYSSRAMRKLPETTGLLLAVSFRNVNVDNTDPSIDVNWNIDGRMLVKSGSAF